MGAGSTTAGLWSPLDERRGHVTWTLTMRITFNGFGEWIWALLIVAVALFETALAALHPDRPRRSSTGLRLVILAFTAFDLVQLAVQTRHSGFTGFNWGHAWDLFALIGEYAKMIRTVPPRKLPAPLATAGKVEV